jgi:hypothetical protein
LEEFSACSITFNLKSKVYEERKILLARSFESDWRFYLRPASIRDDTFFIFTDFMRGTIQVGFLCQEVRQAQ